MKIKRFSIIKLLPSVTLLAILMSGQTNATTSELSAKEILDRVDDLYRGESSRGKMTMSIKTENWSRELTMEYWSLGTEKSLIRILTPKKEKGTATLKSGNDIWNYLPKIKRTIKLPSSMMSQSWMGSHFTNDDLVKESRFVDDYDFEITFRGSRDERKVIEITCIPKEDAAVVWGKVVITVTEDQYLPVEIKDYDEDMKLARTMTFSENKKIGNRTIPTLMLVVPSDKPNESTKVKYDEIEFDIEIDDNFFSLRNLEK